MRTAGGGLWLSLCTVVVVTVVVTGCSSTGRSATDPDAGAAFTEPCRSTEDCESGLCLATGNGDAICTRVCDDDSDCPSGPNWGCVRTGQIAARVCGCAADSIEEICGDGIDNDCNGATDDCRLCDGRPTPIDDHNHCGECGNACRADQNCVAAACRCTPGRIECGEGCVDVQRDETNCGGCGRVCEPGQVCSDGVCGCPTPGTTACGTAGCVDLQRDEANCGVCGAACPTGESCEAGVCSCPGAADVWCAAAGCVDVSSDVSHCGSCDVSCGSGESCESGTCTCASATPDRCGANCTRLEDDANNCGACGRVCPDAQVCRLGTCSCTTSGRQLCGGVCVASDSDVSNCGGCGISCRSGERCVAGACQCDSGLTCGGVCMAAGDTSNCGACGATCGPSQVCSSGSCQCTGSLPDECGAGCVDFATDGANCGACGNVCPATQVCSSGTCACSGTESYCPAGIGCVDLSRDRDNCGTCGHSCVAAEACVAGACRCPFSGYDYCPALDRCVDVRRDPNNCGACGVACRPSESCISSSCRCSWSSRYCASADACIDVRSDDLNCGACDNVCPAGSSCGSSHCTCDVASQTLCGASCTDLLTDDLNCGACGAVCAGSSRCESGSCMCPSGTLSTTLEFTRAGSDVTAAYAGATTGVAWQYYDDSYFTVIGSDASPTSVPENLLMATPAYGESTRRPHVASNGSTYGVMWTFMDSSASGGFTFYNTYFQEYAQDGTTLGPATNVTGSRSREYGLEGMVYSPVGGYAFTTESIFTAGVAQFQRLGAGPPAQAPVALPGATLALAANPSGGWAVFGYEQDGSTRPARFYLMEFDSTGTVSADTRDIDTLSSSYPYPGFLARDGSGWLALQKATRGASHYVWRRGSALTYHFPFPGTSRATIHGMVTEGDVAYVAFEGRYSNYVQRYRLPPNPADAPVAIDAPILASGLDHDAELISTGPNRVMFLHYAQATSISYPACP